MNKICWILITLFFLSACTGDQCIEADDFGFANFTVSARYSSEELSGQTGPHQVAPWRDSSYRVNGKPLAILVRGWTGGLDRNKPSQLSAWCAWYGMSKNTNTLSSFCERLQDCLFVDDQMCTNTKDARISNAPCLFKNGVGLYALIAEAGADPNISFSSERNPSGVTFHLGEPKVAYGMYDIDPNGNARLAGGLVYNYDGGVSSPADLKRKYVDSKLYFKILDKFYDDNSGQYRISIKSGVTATSPDPITFVTNLVKNFLFGTDNSYGLIRNIYMGIINNPGYRTAVSAILSLYIIWTALSYLAGNVQLTHTELIVRVVKIAIVSALLSSEYSWKFFNDYLFVWFVGGMGQILQMIMDAGATGPGSSNIFGMMIAPQTLSKLFSLLFVDWLGFIYIALFIFALYFVAMIFFDAAVIYLTALIAIGMIITMGPIFICFLLFGITKSLFENWLKQLISYAVQPIILFTGLVFISMIIRQEIYGSLGFRVCKQTFPKMSNDALGGQEVISDATRDILGFDVGNSMFYWWFPKPMKGGDFTKTTVNIPIPIDHYTVSGNKVVSANSGDFCEAYGCVGPRYMDLPFLDPAKDQRRLNQFWNGKFVQLDGMLLIFVAIYLLHKFNGLTVSIAKFITGTSGNLTNIRNVADNFTSGFQSYASDRFGNTKIGQAVNRTVTQVKGVATGIVEQAKAVPSKIVDKARISGLKKDAVSKKPNKAVIDEVKKTTGLDHKDIKQGSIKEYKSALKSELKKMDPSLTERQAKGIASKMSHKNSKELENEFSKAKYGKELKDLTPQEKLAIKDIANGNHNGKSLKELASNASASRKYQEAYVDAYQAMSARGISVIGKNSSAIKSLEEIKHKVDSSERLKNDKRKQSGEEFQSGYENLKYGAYGALTGNRHDGFGQKFAGGSYNEIDTNKESGNYRMQTHNEILAEGKKAMEYEQNVVKRIENLSKAKGENVISPEFLAKVKEKNDPNLELYKNLEKEDVKNEVRKALTSGEDPVLKGEKYMSEYAKDSEMRAMADKAEKTKSDMFKNDSFINREEQHEMKHKIAKNDILDKKEMLENHFGNTNISEKEMPQLLEKYYQEQGIAPQVAKMEVDALEQAISDFKSSGHVLAQIDERKQEIATEIDRHISDINEHRVKAGMNQYIPPKTTVGTRSVRKIEDLKRGK